MQQKRKQLFSRTEPQNFYNKLNYHLKKVQPFKGKAKRTVAEQMQLYIRPQKASTIPNNKKYPKQNTYNFQEPDMINQQHVNSNLAQAANKKNFFQYKESYRKNALQRGVSGNKNKKIDIAQRGKSLKYWKTQKAQPKFLTHIKGFFNTFLSQDDGCKCGPICQCRQVLLQWVNVPNQLIKKNYARLHSILHKKQKSPKNLNLGQTQYSYNEQQFDLDYVDFPTFKKQIQKYKIQIQKDVIRTQTQCLLFHRKQIQQKLAKILLYYSIQDPQVGYVQSMNIVVSGILYHVRDEAETYAISRKIFHQIRFIYLNDFKECYKHVEFIIKQIRCQVLDLYEHLEQLGVQMRVILFPWVLSLLCVIVPLDYIHLVYMGFVRNGWQFIYKTVLSVFVYYKQILKQMEQNGDVLVFLSASNDKKQSIDWQDIVNYGQKLQIIV